MTDVSGLEEFTLLVWTVVCVCVLRYVKVLRATSHFGVYISLCRTHLYVICMSRSYQRSGLFCVLHPAKQFIQKQKHTMERFTILKISLL